MASLAASLCPILLISLLAVSVTSYEFQVGGRGDWIKPTGNNKTKAAYNEWASRTRFHIGDSLHFKYQSSDSVLVVNSTAYNSCIVTNPVSTYEDGNTVFRFDRHGFFYFISGESGHCESGEKLVLQVISSFHEENPASPPPQGIGSDDGWDGFDFAPPSLNSSTSNLSAAASCFLAAAALVVFYLLM